MIGFGVVGQSFAELVESESKKLAKDYGLRPKIVGIVDSRGAALAQEGIDIKKALISKKDSGSLEGLGGGFYTAGRNGLDAIRETDCEVVIEATPTD